MTLRAEALSFGFPGRAVGRDIDLDLSPGEALCVLGPNGAGKTTLFRTLLGLIPALAGRVTVSGADVATLARQDIARRIAYVPQSAPIAFDFTLEEIVVMGRTAHLGPFAAPTRFDVDVAHAALERLAIGHLAQRPFDAVSGGEGQLALIARALASEAPFMIMDEPTASLDFGNQARVLEEVARVKDAGIGVLLCSHDPDHAFAIADRVLLLEQGRTLACGLPAAVLTGENLSRLYRLPVEVTGRTVRAATRGSTPPARPLS
jgi:iron complex transport system ATP-binding protein